MLRIREVNSKAEHIQSKNVSLAIAVFLNMIDCHYLAETIHAQNILLDISKVFRDARSELIIQQTKLQVTHNNAVTNGSCGGRAAHDRLDSIIFKTLDEWKLKYRHQSNAKAGRNLLEFVNQKINEKNVKLEQHYKDTNEQ